VAVSDMEIAIDQPASVIAVEGNSLRVAPLA
jgi:inner membrane protein